MTEKLKEAVKKPTVADSLFEDFPSENEFLIDLEQILVNIKKSAAQETYKSKGDDVEEILHASSQANVDQVSFIAIDIDKQEDIASKYGDQIVRHLNKEVGLRIKELLPALFSRYADCTLYHIYADRFYLLLRNFSREEAIEKARRLRKALAGNISIKLSTTQSSAAILPGITVHQGVTSYSYEKLKEILDLPQYPSAYDVVTMITETLDVVLKKGADTVGGDVIYAWNPLGGAFEKIKD